MNTFELNNVRKDSDMFNNKFTKTSPVVEVFAAMVNGEELSRFGAKADKAVEYIKGLGEKAANNDPVAISELNALRRFTIETPIMEEIKMLGIFGSHQQVGYDESIEREVYNHVGERSREQATGGDVVFPAIVKERYPVSTFNISGGYAVDYRRVAQGDMTKENEGLAQVRTDMVNRAKLAVVKKVYEAIKNATGVKYGGEFAGLTKAGVDKILTNIRRFGRPTVVGDYAILSQFTPWAGYVGTINSNTITGISEKAMNELAANGMLSGYNGAILSEMANPYDLVAPTVTDADGEKNFQTMLPAGLAFVIPAGAQSPIATYARGGLTTMSGNDVHTGKILSRFDLEIGVDVARGQEYKIATIYDTNVGGISL